MYRQYYIPNRYEHLVDDVERAEELGGVAVVGVHVGEPHAGTTGRQHRRHEVELLL